MKYVFGFLFAAYSAVSFYCHVSGVPVSELSHLNNTANYALIAYLIAEGF